MNIYDSKISKTIKNKNAFVFKKLFVPNPKTFCFLSILYLVLLSNITTSIRGYITDNNINLFYFLTFFVPNFIYLIIFAFILINSNVKAEFIFKLKIINFNNKHLRKLYKVKERLSIFENKNRSGTMVFFIMYAIHMHLSKKMYDISPVINIVWLTTILIGFCYCGYKEILFYIKRTKLDTLYFLYKKRNEVNKSLSSYCSFCGEKKVDLMMDCLECGKAYF